MAPKEKRVGSSHQTNSSRRKKAAAGVSLLTILGTTAGGFVANAASASETQAANQDATVGSAVVGVFSGSAMAALDDQFLGPDLTPYFDAGYDYDDAVVLAEIWGLDTPWDAKIKAKGLLNSGEAATIPIEPGSAPDAPVEDYSAYEDYDLSPYFEAGYDYDDAVALAGIWGLDTPYDAKIKAKGLLVSGDGDDIPIEPDAPAVTEPDTQPETEPESEQESTVPTATPGPEPEVSVDPMPFLAPYFDAGYDYGDAVALAEIWGLETPEDAKVKAKGLIITGNAGTIPIEPGSAPTVTEPANPTGTYDLSPYFEAGYDYDDAVYLADYWGLSNADEAKIKVKALILAGAEVPIEPGAGPDA